MAWVEFQGPGTNLRVEAARVSAVFFAHDLGPHRVPRPTAGRIDEQHVSLESPFTAAISHTDPTPAEVFGFRVGTDYKVADYEQMQEYYRRLDAASDRVQMTEIGESARGQPMLLLFISSEQNMRELERWRTTSEQLSRARITEEQAQQLARDGKAIIWIDGGMDDQEFAAGQMPPELAYRLATEETREMQKIRQNVVTLLMPILNPDALQNDVTWYRRNVGTPYETTRPPRLGQPHAGTDNNRDWFMNNQPETRNASRILYREWYPQIVYNHHQSAPAFARIFIPPFADPVNPDIHPGVTTGVNMVGAAMANRYAAMRMPGYVSRSVYSMWWNGGMRLTPYFHNQIGILTETAHATPTPRYYDPESFPTTLNVRRGASPRTDSTSIFYPDPWYGTESHLRDGVEYMIEASLATLNLAANYREEFLYNIYRMGRDGIEAGEAGNPFAYVIPPDQWDAGEATNLVNIFRHSGVQVHQATGSFSAGGREYPAGSYIVYAGQAFRPHVVNLMEPQRYPERQRYPGGPPETPYDLAGWTLPMQMGVDADRINEPFRANTQEIEDLAAVPAGRIRGSVGFGYALSRRPNASTRAVNRLMADGEHVYWAAGEFSDGGVTQPAGTFVIEDIGDTRERVEAVARDLGTDFVGLANRPSVELRPLRLPRIGLYKAWASRVDDQGWTLWLLENYEFPVDTLHDADIRNGDLAQYDAVVFPNQSAESIFRGNVEGTMPAEYVGGLGAEGTAALKRFVQQGGTLVALDQATEFPIQHFNLPVRNVVGGLPPEDFFIPGSLIRMNVDVEHPLAHGMQPEVAASFSQSRAFDTIRLAGGREGGQERTEVAPEPAVEVITRYAQDNLLMSGWAMGEERYLAGRAASVQAGLGNGKVVLFGFRPQFRGQPRGTYKLFFNALLAATLRTAFSTDDGGQQK